MGLRWAGMALPALLLAGCSVFGAGGGAPADAGWETHDGYSLRCVGIERAPCEQQADQLAAGHRAERDNPILSIVIDPGDETTICWASTAGNSCRSATP